MLITDLEHVDRVQPDCRIVGGTRKSFRYSKIWEFKEIPDLGVAAYKASYLAAAADSLKARISGYHRGYIEIGKNSIKVGASSSSRSES
ncbi:hypothetical protein V0288_20510 [Pannus brasiliensis CCIBt3594]|uniref:Uncharacterized protein n=1 Tax=Pannus brasiliensis CCIBt3594 TaxID=1427578 RepID=A0AAW9QYP7_9CHRO